MDLTEAIKGRRSIRKFKKQDITDEIVMQLIEAASFAPSAGNIQPWQFVIVRSPVVKEKLVEASFDQVQVEQASVVIVVCAVNEQAATRYGLRGKTLYCLQDTAAATQNILLTAHSMGLGTCWIGAFSESKAKKAINAPESIRPVALIPVGYPDVIPRQRNRKPLNEIIHYDNF